MDNDIKEILFDAKTIQKRVAELGQILTVDYRDKCPIVVCVLRGAVMFFADLTRQMDIYMEMDFVSVSSYTEGSHQSSGQLTIRKDLDKSIEGRHVLIVEDIIDSGLTLHKLVNELALRKPASLKVCTLLDKEATRSYDVHVDYVGFKLEDVFITGYGLDGSTGKYRNLPYIGVLKPKVYSSDASDE